MNRADGLLADGGATPLADAARMLNAELGLIDRSETVPLESAAGRVLSEPVTAKRNMPHFRRAERDGYAVKSEDVTTATADEPVVLSEAEEPLKAGETSYVHTGSAVPEGADAVVMIEDATESSAGIAVHEAVTAGTYVTPIGAELEAGQILYETGDRLRPGDLGVLKGSGIEAVTVRERPRVAVIPTGEELVQETPAPGQVLETNGLVGAALVEHWCGEPTYRDVVTDDRDALAAAIERDLGADLIVTSGGSSVGARDLLPAVVEDRGRLLVEELALRPGHSASIGVVSGTPIVMLPGTPIAALVVAWLLVRPALSSAMGAETIAPPTTLARIESDVASSPDLRTVHGISIQETETPSEVPTAKFVDGGGLPSLSRINGWLQVGESTTEIQQQELVSVERWGDGPC